MISLIDIAVNLTDPMYQGIYNGKKCHNEDIDVILKRAQRNGVVKIMITGTNLEESKHALQLARTNDMLFCTVGCHPTNTKEFLEKELNYMNDLRELIKEGNCKVIAVGEFGLDYDRLEFSSRDVQKEYFEKQFVLAEESKLPLFLHMRNASKDFIDIIRKNRKRFSTGVVHSFTGNSEEAIQIVEQDLYIGINGCSLKTEENLEVVRVIPIERIMIETDGPWCDIRPSHAGFKYVKTHLLSKDKKKYDSRCLVKGRNEPCNVLQVLEIISEIKQIELSILSNQILKNINSVFFNK
jgi:TatD DNase family protein